MTPKTGLARAILVVIGLFAGFLVSEYRNNVSCDQNAEYNETQSAHLRRLDGASADGRVVFLGSSTFQGLDVSAITPFGLNLSVGGDSLQGLIKRSMGYRSLTMARAVVINIGLNDLIERCDQHSMNVESLFSLMPIETPIVLVGIQELSTAGDSCKGDDLSTKIVEFNQRLSKGCLGRGGGGCRFVSNPVTVGMDESARRKILEPDGIHLSKNGYKLLSSAIMQELDEAVVAH